jgi:hypothetical protein
MVAYAPISRWVSDGDGLDPRYVSMERALRFWQPHLPGLDAIHYSGADSPEECILALGLTFNSLIFPTLFPALGYMEWYLEQEDTWQKYQKYRWLLQVYQSREPERRLTPKAPAPTGNLEPLTQAIPDALLVRHTAIRWPASAAFAAFCEPFISACRTISTYAKWPT